MKFSKKVISSITVLIATGVFSQFAYPASDSQAEVALENERLALNSADNALIQLANSLTRNNINRNNISKALSLLDKHWQAAYIAPLLEILSLNGTSTTARKIINLLEKRTGKEFNNNTNKWYFWLWNEPENIVSYYADLKATLYQQVDPKFNQYFRGRQKQAAIRLDEIRWGGVVQDGIPPLRYPKMLIAENANYLADDNIVFGIEVNGDARAYPKRILAWHEMFVDSIGGIEIAGVYCTLCGTVIPYKTTANGIQYDLGTSGFLYRSNKLMYDQKTQSLWSTVKGEPVVGPLVNKGIALEHIGVVTTTWGEWKRRHPKTKVLSLDTGYRRNYGEGVAYNAYFSTDQLMFNTPFIDTRLNNKQEVLALRFFASPKEQLAIDTDFLSKNWLYKTNIGRQKLLILTDLSGANRVYDPKEVDFVSYDQDSTLVDSTGEQWILEEHSLVAKKSNRKLTSLPYRRAFWFGWHAVFPETKLIK
ncbi:MAG: DUF3179 domain-containing protein [Oceanospirillaceae bacterium]